MPAKPFVKIDPTTRARAIAYAVKYYNDASLGAGKRFPTTAELQQKFGENVTLEAIKPDLSQTLTAQQNPFAPTPSEVEEVQKATAAKAEKKAVPYAAHSPSKESVGTKTVRVTLEHVSAFAVLDEVQNVIEDSKNQIDLKPKLQLTIKDGVKKALLDSGVQLDDRELDTIASTIGIETAEKITANLNSFSREELNSLIAQKIASDIQNHQKLQEQTAAGTLAQAFKETPKIIKEDQSTSSASIAQKTQLETMSKITPAIQEKVEQILPEITSEKLTQEQLKTIAAEVASESASDIVENLGKIAGPEQINSLVADSLTQNILAHPNLEGKVKLNEEKLFEKLASTGDFIAETHSADLQKTAVLSKIALALKKPDQTTQSLIAQTVNDSIELDSPLLAPEKRQKVHATTARFLEKYQTVLKLQLATQTPTSFETLTHAQNTAYQLASSHTPVIAPSSLHPKLGFSLGLIIDPNHYEAAGLGNARATPLTFFNTAKLRAKGAGFALASDKAQQQAFYALLGHDGEKLKQSIRETATVFEKLKAKKSLTYKERKIYRQIQKKLRVLTQAQSFSQSNSSGANTYLSYFRFLKNPPGPGTIWASQSAWQTTQAFFNNHPGVYVPQSALSARFMAQRSFGGMAFQLGDFIKMAKGPGFGLGKAGMGTAKAIESKAGVLMIGGIAAGYMGKLFKGSATALGLMGLYFLKLGMAALAGFMMGATIGFGVGAVAGGLIGFQIGLALAPFTFGLSVPFFTVLGALGGGALGAAILGFAGGLIGYGLASGSTAALGMGAGAGVGGVVGGITGGVLGATIGTAVCLGFALCGLVGAYIGASAGAIVGAVAGAAIGWGIGKALSYIGFQGSGALTGAAIGFYVGGPLGALVGAGIGWLIGGGWHTIANFFSGGAIATSAAVSGFFGGIASIGSAIGSALGSAGSSILGAFSSAASAIGSLGIGGIAAGAGAGIVLSSSLGPLAALAIVGGVVTSAAFSTADKDKALSGTGDNAYFTVTKKPEPDKIATSDLAGGKDVKFTIDLKAKVKLHDITIADEMSSQKPSSSPYQIQVASPPCTIAVTLDKDEEKSCDFTVNIKNNGHKFDNEVITNTVTVQAKTEEGKDISDYVEAYVLVGNSQAPSANPDCPNTWPFTPDVTSYVTQGPLGATDHARLNLEAIDLGVNIQPVVATIDGTLLPSFNGGGGPLDNRVELIPDKICGELQSIWYYHMANVEVEGHVTKGQTIGTSGDYFNASICIDQYGQNVCGPHLHYQFNGSGRTFPMQSPNIPKFVKPDCNSAFDCGVLIP